MKYTPMHEYDIVNGPSIPDAQPVGRPYKTKKGAMNYLFREWVGPNVPDRAEWEVEVVKQPDGMWVPFINSALAPVTRGDTQ